MRQTNFELLRIVCMWMIIAGKLSIFFLRKRVNSSGRIVHEILS